MSWHNPFKFYKFDLNTVELGNNQLYGTVGICFSINVTSLYP